MKFVVPPIVTALGFSAYLMTPLTEYSCLQTILPQTLVTIKPSGFFYLFR